MGKGRAKTPKRVEWIVRGVRSDQLLAHSVRPVVSFSATTSPQ
jgi:hypothetical protein